MAYISSGWFFFLGFLIAVFIVAWAILTKRPVEKEVVNQFHHLDPNIHEIHLEDEIGHETNNFINDDNFEIIEGIGPRIAELLRSEGIKTFDQLSKASAEDLRLILNKANLRINNPGSWPKQARLAASGDMAELEKYKERLKGGIEV